MTQHQSEYNAPRGGTALRIIKDTRGGIMINQEEHNIERRVVALTADPETDKKINNNLAEGQPCGIKPTASKQQGQ